MVVESIDGADFLDVFGGEFACFVLALEGVEGVADLVFPGGGVFLIGFHPALRDVEELLFQLQLATLAVGGFEEQGVHGGQLAGLVCGQDRLL